MKLDKESSEQITKLIGRDGQAFVNTRVIHVIQSLKILKFCPNLKKKIEKFGELKNNEFSIYN